MSALAMRPGMRPLVLAALVLAAAVLWWIGAGPWGALPAGDSSVGPAASGAAPVPRAAAAMEGGDEVAAKMEQIAAVSSPAAMEHARQLAAATFMSGKEVEPLPVGRLVERLPAKLAGFTLAGSDGERTEQAGLPVSTARGRYVNNAGGTLTLAISDLAGPRGVAAYAGWSLLDAQDNSSDAGYERTRTAGDRQYYESWESGGGQAEAAVVLAGRVLVSISGTVDQAAAQSALAGVDAAALERLVHP